MASCHRCGDWCSHDEGYATTFETLGEVLFCSPSCAEAWVSDCTEACPGLYCDNGAVCDDYSPDRGASYVACPTCKGRAWVMADNAPITLEEACVELEDDPESYWFNL